MILETNGKQSSKSKKKGGDECLTKAGDDNRSNQLNSNNDAYWQSRGYDERPDEWEERSKDDDDKRV